MTRKTHLEEFVEEHNEHNIDESSVQFFTTRVKVFLINGKNEILVATSNGGCQLPGGHIEEGESLAQGLIREVKEETGIALDENEIVGKFYTTKHWQNNYQNSCKNRLSQIIYFFAKTDKQPNLDNLKLTDREKINNFEIKFVNLSSFENFVATFINTEQKEINIAIAKEMLKVYQYFTKIIK